MKVFMSKGRHAYERPDKKTAKTITAGAALLAGSITPVVVATPAGAATVEQWDKVAQCESSGQWNRPDGDFGKSSGGLQFQPASWSDALAYLRSQGVDTSGYPQGPGHQAYRATKQQQIIAGEALLALQGPGAWTCNAKVGSPLGASMFKGGPAPYSTDTPAPTPPPAVTGPPDADSGVYVVKRGDWLAKIAENLRVDGGWQNLYRINKAAIGPNPNLIHPGQKLALPGHEAPTPPPAPKVTPPPPPAPSAAFVLPVSGRVGDGLIVGSGGSMSRSAGGHSGLDISAPHGTPVKSAGAGTVVSKNASGAAYGNHVVIKHSDGLYTLYAHLSAISVGVGQSVAASQQIGTVGSTGNSSGPHLHFEVRTHPTAFSAGVFLNPIAWLRSHGVTV